MTKAMRSTTFRLLPCQREKALALCDLEDGCRFAWNKALEYQEWLYALKCMYQGYGIEGTLPVSKYSLFKDFTVLRRKTPWLRKLPYAVVRETLKFQADAWQAFFKGDKGHPKFKAKGHHNVPIRLPEVRLNGPKNRIYIPGLGWHLIRHRGRNPYEQGTPKVANLTRECNRWFCSITYEVDIEARRDDGSMLAVDRNVRQCTDSTGEFCRLPCRRLAKLEGRKRRLQRRLARQQKGSGRRSRVRLRHGKVCRRIKNVRSNYHHHTTRKIASKAHTVVLEDLNVAGMTQSAKGTVESPGRHVKQKSGLNRAIRHTGWVSLETQLRYKCGNVVKVPPMYTSQTCHKCGWISKENRNTQARFKCIACGHEDNADVNAALNILALGTGATGHGDCRAAWSVKRQNYSLNGSASI